jgi:hypothetical protein
MSLRHITDEELATLRFHLKGAVWKTLSPAPLEYRGKYAGEGHALMNALAELALRRRKDTPKTISSPLTKALLELKVGESRVLTDISHGAMSSARKTAQRHSGNPSARFRIRSLGNRQVVISRDEDGTPCHPRLYAQVVYGLASMEIGHSKVFELSRKAFPHDAKLMARKMVNNPSANWKSQKLANGKWRVRRIT